MTLGCKLLTIKLTSFGVQAKLFWVKTIKLELFWGAERPTQVILGCRASSSRHLGLQTLNSSWLGVQDVYIQPRTNTDAAKIVQKT